MAEVGALPSALLVFVVLTVVVVLKIASVEVILLRIWKPWAHKQPESP